MHQPQEDIQLFKASQMSITENSVKDEEYLTSVLFPTVVNPSWF